MYFLLETRKVFQLGTICVQNTKNFPLCFLWKYEDYDCVSLLCVTSFKRPEVFYDNQNSRKCAEKRPEVFYDNQKSRECAEIVFMARKDEKIMCKSVY